MKKIPPLVQNLIKFLIGAGAIWLLIRSGALDPKLIGHAITSHPFLCLFAFLTYGILVVVPGWLRWFLLIRQTGLHAPVGRIFSLAMIGIFFNSLIPGGTGGDLIKGFYLYREHEDKDKTMALTSIAMDRFVGLYALLVVAMVMMLINTHLWIHSKQLAANSFFYAGIFLSFTAAIVFYFSPYSDRWLQHPKWFKLPGGKFFKTLFDTLLVYRKNPLNLLYALALGMVVDLGLILLYYFCALALDVKLSFAVHGFVVPTLTMINGIPISPSGVGVGEVAGDFIYNRLGVSQGGEILALVHICVLLMSLFGAPFYFFYRVKPVQKISE